MADGEQGHAKLDHVGIAVHDLERAAALYIDALGGDLVAGGDAADHYAMRSLHIEFPAGGKLEVLAPTSAESPLQSHLDRHGEGFHHLTFWVPDLDTTVTALIARGFPCTLTDRSLSNWPETYVKRSETMGTLLQVVAPPADLDQNADNIALADVLAGRWRWRNALPYQTERD